jgi:hypothetical protein
MTNATIRRTNAVIGVKIAPNGALTQSGAALTLKNTIIAGTGTRLDSLLDVTADNANTVAGSTLVYDPSTDTYIVKLLDLNGGEF